ncbi:GT4 family glycosyltransferase PelF [Candidatus Chrysopegis kryptomonas]|uniref:Glycosyltransferase involved in cell wall bisynthesis n=1 Tax=Candidatus Chryseopegocella kryptomonas TaxID=1633643 RepID=A0A0P1NU31_9BACT|nr:GT4 family glycosyltransferase PelF [Candidatus Chrysopegis kryptomonas]CUT02580.1 Glycosyltransferase involved in cell wall bisynthesis [Candidatus Chrysopegis kryptomonas]
MVDVCLILEGTYPYVIGGVSKWVHELVKNLNHLKFSILHLYADERKEIKFEIPMNVDSIVEIDVRNGLGFKFDFKDVISFIPNARIYHSLSTGFAGLLGLQIKQRKNKPFILTEHGIYWKELEFGVNEVECGFKIFKDEKIKNELCSARREYLKIFKDIAMRCYLEADLVTTVCRYNLEQQLSLIPSELIDDLRRKFRVIENFVDEKFLDGLSRVKDVKNVVFIGRVVPIKDVKTFIRAIPLILEEIGDVKFYVVGDLRQDFDYAMECFKLAESLGINERVIFTGEANSVDYLKIADVLVLPSVSEAQPFVVLEAMALGVPVVASSVGGVPELVNEAGNECGLLFEVGDYRMLAQNVIRILRDENLEKILSRNGIKKAKRFTLEKFVKSYREIYESFLNE